MDYVRWNKVLAAMLLVCALAIVLTNVLVDPYEVFRVFPYRGGYSLNERFSKVDYVLKNKTKFNAFLVGSSVMGVFDPEQANALDPHCRFYNLSYLRGTPAEVLATLRTLKTNGVGIRKIVMGIDLFPFIDASEAVEPFRRPHPSVSGESFVLFYSSYLFSSGMLQGYSRLTHAFEPQPNILFDLRGSGQYKLLSYDRDIALNHAAFIKRQFFTHSQAEMPAEFVWVDKRFSELKELANWVREQGIDAAFFIHPFHHSTLTLVDPKSLADFRQRIFTILGVIPDYSRDVHITNDDTNYYDKKHYRPAVARKILALTIAG